MSEKDLNHVTKSDKVDTDELIRKIDAKIAELEAEEAKERANGTYKDDSADMAMLFGALLGGSSRRTSVSYEMSEEQLQGKPWGEMREGNLSMGDMMLLTDLCQNASEQRISYLVHMYNDRSEALEPIEAHFVARYATRRGYNMVTDEEGKTKFEKVQVDEEAKREAVEWISSEARRIEEERATIELEPTSTQKTGVKGLVKSIFKRNSK